MSQKKEVSASGYIPLPDDPDDPDDCNHVNNKGKEREDTEGEEKEDEALFATSSMFEAAANLLGDLEGTAILSLPYLIKKAGLIAIAIIVLAPCICIYTGKILIECLYEKSTQGSRQRVRSSYMEIGSTCWPRYGGTLVVAFQIIVVLMACTLYLVLCASLAFHSMANFPIPERALMAIFAAVCLPTLFIEKLSQLAWISLVSVISLTAALLLIIGYGFWEHRSWRVEGVVDGLLIWDDEWVIITVCVVTFGYCAHAILPTLEASLKDKSHFNKMLCLTFTSSTLIKVVFSVTTFIAFNSNIQEIISNGLPRNAIGIAINSLLVANSLFCYPFCTKMLMSFIEELIPKHISSHAGWYWGFRVCIVIATLLPGVLIPHFALLMAVAGSITGVSITFILPCVFHLILKYNDLGYHEIILEIVIVIFGAFVAIAGFVFTGKKLIASYM